jgi:hypothetical protein
MMACTLKDVSGKVIQSLAVEYHQCIEVEISDTDIEILLQKNENDVSGSHKYRSHDISYTEDDEMPFDEMSIAAVPETTCRHTRMRKIFSNEIFDKHMDSGEDTTFTTFPGSETSSDTVTQGSDSNKQVVSKVCGTGSLYQPSDSDSSGTSSATSTSSAYVCGADFFSTMTHGSETSSDITQDSESSNEILRKLLLVENGPLHALSRHTIEENSSIEEISSSDSEYEEASESLSDVVLTLIYTENFKEEEEEEENKDGISTAKEGQLRQESTEVEGGKYITVEEVEKDNYIAVEEEEFQLESQSTTGVDNQPMAENTRNMPDKRKINDDTTLVSIETSRSHDEDTIQEIEDDFSESESDDDNESEGELSNSGSDGTSENDVVLTLIYAENFKEEEEEEENKDGISIAKEGQLRQESTEVEGDKYITEEVEKDNYIAVEEEEFQLESQSTTGVDNQPMTENTSNMPDKRKINDDTTLVSSKFDNIETSRSYDEDTIQEIEDDFSESESDDDNEYEGELSDSGSDGTSENEEENKLILSDEDEGLISNGIIPSKIDDHASREAEVVATSEQRKNKHGIMTIAMFDYMLLQGDDDEESFVDLVALSTEENDISAHDC